MGCGCRPENTVQEPGWILPRCFCDSLRVALGEKPSELLTSLLRDVSRSFYLTMRVLPGAIRPQISLAYLLARTTDTIADTELVPVEERLSALDRLRDRIVGRTSAPLDFSRFAGESTVPHARVGQAGGGGPPARTAKAERALLRRVEDALAALSALTAEDQQRVREVLATITGGQELDLQRFGKATRPPEGGTPPIVALQTDAELDDYTYRVAGCVGEFWTKMCRTHLFPEASLDEAALLANGVRFGKGLQLVNILRDVPADLRRGRCYVPGERLSVSGLAPLDLLAPANEPRVRPLYDGYLDLAESHLAAGWVYTNSLPHGQVRVRLACAWPILIGVRTLAKLRASEVLDPAKPVKIARAEARRILVQSVVAYPWPGMWRRLFAKAAK